jgi:hypothetical protein
MNNRMNSNSIMTIIMIVITTAVVVFFTYKYVKNQKKGKAKTNTKKIKTVMSHKDSIEWTTAVKEAKAEVKKMRKQNVPGATKEQAIKMAKKFIKERMDYPDYVKFKDDMTYSSNTKGFNITQTCNELTGDGSQLAIKYTIHLVFTGGDANDFSRWSYDSLVIKNLGTGRVVEFYSPENWK